MASLLLILCWAYLLFVDTIWGQSIPGGMFLRGFVPLVLLGFWLGSPLAHTCAIPPAVRFFLLLFTAVGILSVAFSVSPLLAGLKLAAYLAVMLSLLQPAIARRFGPNSQALWRLSQLGFFLLPLNVFLLPGSRGGLMQGPNGMGGLALIVFPLMLFNASVPFRNRRRMGQVGLVLCVIIALLSRGRGSSFAIYVMCVVHYMLGRFRSGGFGVLAAVLFCLLSASGAIALAGYNEYVRSYIYKGDGQRIFAGERERMLAECTRAFEQRPLLGWGFGLSHRVTPDAFDTFLRTGRLSGSVGELGSSTLGLLVGGGVLLLLAFVGVVGSIIAAGLKSLFAPLTPAPIKEQLRAFIAGIIGLLLIGQTENVLMAPLTSLTMLFWFFGGIVIWAASIRTSSLLPVRNPVKGVPNWRS